METGGIVINKYGAVDAQEIIKMRGRVLQLERVIAKMAGLEDYAKELFRQEAFSYYDAIHYELPEDFKKMKELTKCDDYEFEITPEVTKLVKKQKDKNG